MRGSSRMTPSRRLVVKQRAGGVDAAQRHAAVLRLDDDADALRLQNILDRFGDLGGELFLNLQPSREAMHDPREL